MHSSADEKDRRAVVAHWMRWDHLCLTTFMTIVGCMALPCVQQWMCLWAGRGGPAAQGMHNGPGYPGWCDYLVANHQAGALAEPGPFWMPWFSMCILRAVLSWHACVSWHVVCVVVCCVWGMWPRCYIPVLWCVVRVGILRKVMFFHRWTGDYIT